MVSGAAVCCLMYARCPLAVVCYVSCVLSVGCRSLYGVVACCMLDVVCCVLCGVWCLVVVACSLSVVDRCLLLVGGW